MRLPAHGARSATMVVNTAAGRLALRLGLWLLGYVAITTAWAAHNAVPAEMLAAVGFLPVCLVTGLWFYRKHKFAREVWEEVSEWEMLISFLVLATGMASGLLMLISLGWTSLGIILLRPVGRNQNWPEWFKLPILFFFCLPVWMDLAGSRHDWLQLSGVRLVTASGAEAGFSLAGFQVVSRACLLVVFLCARGALFWVMLALIPAALWCGVWIQNGPLHGAGLGMLFKWVFAPVALGAVSLLAGRDSRLVMALDQRWLSVARRIFGRFPAPWLAATVILLQQSSLAEGWLAQVTPRFNAAGAALLLAVLYWMRLRSGPSPLSLNSRLGLAAALFVLLAAEWTDLNPLRHLALGLLVISAASWGRPWRWTVFALALTGWLALIPAPQVLLVRFGMSPARAGDIAWLGLGVAVTWLVALVLTDRAVGSTKFYHDNGWQPVKRFAFILLALLIGFQTITAFWSGDRVVWPGRPAGGVSRWPLMASLSEGERVRQWALAWEKNQVVLAVLVPPDAPVRIYAPELLFTSADWTIEGRRLIPHENGQVVELRLRNGPRRAFALYWFFSGGRAFADYLRARHVLWSGWNLDRRDLRLAVVYSDEVPGPEQLVKLAVADEWFARELTIVREAAR